MPNNGIEVWEDLCEYLEPQFSTQLPPGQSVLNVGEVFYLYLAVRNGYPYPDRSFPHVCFTEISATFFPEQQFVKLAQDNEDYQGPDRITRSLAIRPGANFADRLSPQEYTRYSKKIKLEAVACLEVDNLEDITEDIGAIHVSARLHPDFFVLWKPWHRVMVDIKPRIRT